VLIASLCAAAFTGVQGVAQAEVRANTWERFVLDETTCSGERVTLDVRVHFVGIETTTPNGRLISGSHLASVAGTATTESGARYVFRDGSNTTSTDASLTGPVGASTFTSTLRLRLMRTGRGGSTDDDLIFRALFHVTVNANGDTTVQLDRPGPFECR
jgi:hypothetical protein